MSDWNNQSGGKTECSASLETLEHVFLPRNQLALAVLDVGSCAKAVVLKLENPVGMIERRVEARRINRLDAGEDRLNVASSRAQCVAVIVASPALFRAQCKTRHCMATVSASASASPTLSEGA